MPTHNRALIFLLGAAYLVILASSLYQRFTNPALTVANLEAGAQASPTAMAAIGPLMQAVATNPGDGPTLLKLVRSLMAINQWEGAENFAQRALSLNGQPKISEEAQYLLAVIHHNQGRHREAAELLEKMLAKGNNPSARYSLAILYIHFLNKPQQGIEQLERGLRAQQLPPALEAAMKEELGKARLHQLPVMQSSPSEAAGEQPKEE